MHPKCKIWLCMTLALDHVLYGEEILATTTSAEMTLLLPPICFCGDLVLCILLCLERVCVFAARFCSDSPKLLTQQFCRKKNVSVRTTLCER